MSELWPCQRNPDRWFSPDRRELGRAVHDCLSHCRRLAECHDTEARPHGGVLAGVHYVVAWDSPEPKPERRKLREVPCGACGPEPKPPKDPRDTGACGTPKGFHRHTRAGEQACEPCTLAKLAYQRERYRTWARKRVSV